VGLKFTDLPGTQVTTSLDRVFEALDADHEFLLAGEVFTSDLIDACLEHKRSDVPEVRLRPHSREFALYFDA
jgi:glutamine synthetase